VTETTLSISDEIGASYINGLLFLVPGCFLLIVSPPELPRFSFRVIARNTSNTPHLYVPRSQGHTVGFWLTIRRDWLQNRLSSVFSRVAVDCESNLANGSWKCAEIYYFYASHRGDKVPVGYYVRKFGSDP